jgi:oxygen-independent coproporphyrinogen III oxidase
MAGIYIHVPFCRKKCHYCDFYKIKMTGLLPAYIEALKHELVLRRDYIKGEKIESIYFGGGTPSLLSAGQIRSITDAAGALHEIAHDCEITLEANPDDINREYLAALSGETPVNRMSLGIQSFFDDDLKFLNRRHDASKAFSSIEECLEYGFNNLSIDLIYGIPVSSASRWEKNLKYAISSGAPHISAYHLSIDRGTPLYKLMAEGKVIPADEEESLRQYRILCSTMKNAGFEHYEISNFCRNALYSRHNIGYWQQKIYLGLGTSAHSFNLHSRQWNLKGVGSYIKKAASDIPEYETEVTDRIKRYNEYVMVSLRTIKGADATYLRKSMGAFFGDHFIKEAARFVDSGIMLRNGERYHLTEESWFVSDNIISSFFIVE